MSDFVKWLVSRVTGGRPMKRIEYRFTDLISGSPVYYYEDTFGRVWLATDAWSWFRVAPPSRGEER